MKVTLLGDSIRQIGYGTRVPALLADEFEVFQPNDNCRFAKYTLRVIHNDEAAMAGTDIIHWNNGLWDICQLFDDGHFTPIDEYIQVMLRLARLLKQRARTVIFATTTPVDNHPQMTNEHIIAYNERIVPILRDEGILINDLHGLVYPKLHEYILAEDHIHLTEAGIEACAQQVATVIRDAAAKLR